MFLYYFRGRGGIWCRQGVDRCITSGEEGGCGVDRE